MQLTTFLSTASAIVATASATRSAVTLNQQCDLSQPRARIINRCPYDVHLWSVFKGNGCPDSQMVTLKTGESYAENYDEEGKTSVGVSIKLSKSKECKGADITQLEYFRAVDHEEKTMQLNYLDVSYVDCGGMDCPARKDGYYLVAGTQVGDLKASAANTWCPILSCSDAKSCDTMSYVLPDDIQTKTCKINASIDFYMCGSEAPSGDYDSAPQSKPEPSSTKQAGYPTTPSPTPAEEYAHAAAITPSPSSPGLIKTEIVYVTAYVNAKRHEHGHRHQVFHA
jgi:hypothetical protein